MNRQMDRQMDRQFRWIDKQIYGQIVQMEDRKIDLKMQICRLNLPKFYVINFIFTKKCKITTYIFAV